MYIESQRANNIAFPTIILLTTQLYGSIGSGGRTNKYRIHHRPFSSYGRRWIYKRHVALTTFDFYCSSNRGLRGYIEFANFPISSCTRGELRWTWKINSEIAELGKILLRLLIVFTSHWNVSLSFICLKQLLLVVYGKKYISFILINNNVTFLPLRKCWHVINCRAYCGRRRDFWHKQNIGCRNNIFEYKFF